MSPQPLKTVSFQGIQLSVGQKNRLAQQQLSITPMGNVISDLVKEVIQCLDDRKEQGAKPETIWTLDWQDSGTLCIAEWMGY